MLRSTLGGVRSTGLDKYMHVMTCIYHYGIIRSVFTALKIPGALPIYI